MVEDPSSDRHCCKTFMATNTKEPPMTRGIYGSDGTWLLHRIHRYVGANGQPIILPRPVTSLAGSGCAIHKDKEMPSAGG